MKLNPLNNDLFNLVPIPTAVDIILGLSLATAISLALWRRG